MKTFDQLAQSAYAAYCKKASELDDEGLAAHAATGDQLDHGTKECWIAVSKQLLAELAAIH